MVSEKLQRLQSKSEEALKASKANGKRLEGASKVSGKDEGSFKCKNEGASKGFEGENEGRVFLAKANINHISGPVGRSWQRKEIHFKPNCTS